MSRLTAPREVRNGQIARFTIPRYLKFVDSVPMTVTDKVQRPKMRGEGIEELGLVGTAAWPRTLIWPHVRSGASANGRSDGDRNSVKTELRGRAARAELWASA